MSTALLLLLACTQEPAGSADTAGGGDGGTADEAGRNKVLVIGIDGVRPDALQAADTPAIDQLMAEGSGTLDARTQLTGPTSSGPGWTSIFTGVEVEDHGVTTNGVYDSLDGTWPTIVARSVAAGRTAISAVHWPDVNSGILETDLLSLGYLADDDGVTDWMADQLVAGDWDLHIVHLDDVDAAGHASGFSADNPDYVAAIEAQDDRSGRLLAALQARAGRADEQWTVIVVTDHGGEGTSHGAMDADCQTIPWLVWGDAVPAAPLDSANHMDTAPTALAGLGISVDPAWQLDGAVRGLASP